MKIDRRSRAFRRAITLTALLCTLIVLLLFVSCGATGGESGATGVTSVQLNGRGDKLKITVSLGAEDLEKYQKESLYLFALDAADTVETVESGKLAPLSDKSASATMRYEVAFRYDNDQRTRLTQRFLIAAKTEGGYRVLSEAAYLSNPEVLASESRESGMTTTLKGLSVAPGENMQDLSPAHTVVDVDVFASLLPAPVRGETLSYLYEGETVTIRKDAAEALREELTVLSAMGSEIYLRPLLAGSAEDTAAVLGLPEASEAGKTLPDLKDERVQFLLSGFFSFLADEYLLSSDIHMAGVIVGEPLNGGEVDASAFPDHESYARAMLQVVRTAHNIFRSRNASVRVYVPISNLYTTDKAMPVGAMPSREFLAMLAAYAEASGDFDYGVYLSIQMPNAGNAIYNESGTVHDGSTTKKYILPRTMTDLNELLRSEALLYHAKPREMMWGISIAGGETLPESAQRLSLAYTYYKAVSQNMQEDKTLPWIRAVIWETVSDTEGDFTGLFYTDGREKSAAALYRLLGTRDFARKYDVNSLSKEMGAAYTEISEVIEKSSSDDISITVSVEQNAFSGSETELFGSAQGFGDSFSTFAGNGVLTLKRKDGSLMLSGTYDKAGSACGVYTEDIDVASLSESNKLMLRLYLALPAGVNEATVRFSLLSRGSHDRAALYGTATVPGNAWVDLTFDIEEFFSLLGTDDDLTLSVSFSETGVTAETPLTFYLLSVKVLETRSWFVRGGWIVSLVVLIALLITVFLVWFFHTYEVSWKSKSGEDFSHFIRRMTAGLRVKKRSSERVKVKMKADIPEAHTEENAGHLHTQTAFVAGVRSLDPKNDHGLDTPDRFEGFEDFGDAGKHDDESPVEEERAPLKHAKEDPHE